jgi:hypothetical protein
MAMTVISTEQLACHPFYRVLRRGRARKGKRMRDVVCHERQARSNTTLQLRIASRTRAGFASVFVVPDPPPLSAQSIVVVS